MAHKKIIDSVKKQGQVTIKDLDEFLRFVIYEYDMRTFDANYISILTSVASHLSGDLFVAIPGVSCIATFKDLLQVCKKNGICLVEAFDMDGKLLPKEVEKGQEGNHITVESAREK